MTTVTAAADLREAGLGLPLGATTGQKVSQLQAVLETRQAAARARVPPARNWSGGPGYVISGHCGFSEFRREVAPRPFHDVALPCRRPGRQSRGNREPAAEASPTRWMPRPGFRSRWSSRHPSGRGRMTAEYHAAASTRGKPPPAGRQSPGQRQPRGLCVPPGGTVHGRA